jgi:hypothetical protein
MRHFINIVTSYNSQKILNENLQMTQATKAYDKAAKLLPAEKNQPSNKSSSSSAIDNDVAQQISNLKKRIKDFFTIPPLAAADKSQAQSSPQLDALKVLGLPSTATPMQVKLRYRQLAKKLHPDLVGNNKSLETEMKKVSMAYNLLKSSFFDKKAK